MVRNASFYLLGNASFCLLIGNASFYLLRTFQYSIVYSFIIRVTSVKIPIIACSLPFSFSVFVLLLFHSCTWHGAVMGVGFTVIPHCSFNCQKIVSGVQRNTQNANDFSRSNIENQLAFVGFSCSASF